VAATLQRGNFRGPTLDALGKLEHHFMYSHTLANVKHLHGTSIQ